MRKSPGDLIVVSKQNKKIYQHLWLLLVLYFTVKDKVVSQERAAERQVNQNVVGGIREVARNLQISVWRTEANARESSEMSGR